MAINILLWYNENNPLSTTFAQGFSEDIQKGLVRFHPDFKLRVNEPRAEGDCCLVVISSTDISDSEFIGRSNEILSKTDTLLLSVDPFDLNSLIGVKKQPFLFWDKQYETGEIRLYQRDNIETKSNYWEKITDIAVNIHNLFTEVDLKDQGDYVYLSQDDISHNADRENIMRDLNDLGYKVLPNKPFSSDFDTCTHEIEDALANSKLIVHIIPPIYNIYFADHHLSLTEHQCNISANYMVSKSSNAIRVIWISSVYDITDEENQVFIEKIQRDQEQTRNTAVLKTTIEDLKRHYRHLLAQKTGKANEAESDTDVYVILDGNNNGLEKEVEGAFKQQNLSVASNFSGITYTQHLKKLARAGIVVLCYSSDNVDWLGVKVNDILKSKGVDSARPFEKVVLVKSDDSLDVRSLEHVFTDVISDINQLSFIVKK